MSAVRVLATLLVATALAAPAAAQDGFTADIRLDPDVVGVGEPVRLEIRIESPNQRFYPEPVFQLDNLRILAGPSQSTSIRIVNGAVSTTYALIWQLAPEELGTARVHSVRLTVSGQTTDLPDREAKVVTDPPPRRRASRDPLDRFFDGRYPPDQDDPWAGIFDRRPRRPREPPQPQILLAAEVTPARPYVGQQALYTLHLYTQADIHSVNPTDIPDFQGFWVQAIPQPDQLQPALVEHRGERFGKVVLLQRALFPRRAGSFELEPISAQLTARLPDESPFGLLMPRAREITRRSNPVRLEVRELPPGPEGFTGAVGRLDLAATLEPRSIEVGEAATLTVELAGRGHLQGIAAPGLPELPGVEVFPPQQQGEDELRGDGVHGRRVWSYVLVPSRPGDVSVPAIELPYFDPAAGEYRVASTEPLVLAVRGQTRVATESGETVELHSIRTAALPAAESGAGRRLEPWLFAVPWGVGALVLALRRGRAGGGHGRRRLLHRLAEAAREDRPRQAAAVVEEAWRDYLAERFAIARGTPSPQWAARLEERGVRRETAEELVRLADDIHYLRYAPKLSSTEELQRELAERSRRVLGLLAR